MKNIKRFLAAALITSLIFTDEAISNAAETTNASANESAGVIENITGTENINTDTYSDKNSIAIADGYDVIVDIPKDGNNAVVMDDGEKEKIEMYLPDEASDSKGVLTENGTIVYNNEEKSVTVGVQPLQESTNNVSFEGVRTTITIADSTASKEYEFTYDLPDGYKLVTAANYLGEEYDTGEVYIIDKDNIITTIIDPAWAKDANGSDIETYYKVNGNKLIQVVNFDEDTAFPVVADPSAWKIGMCIANIAAFIAGYAFPIAKIMKAKQYIKALGGLKTAATLLMKYSSITAIERAAIGKATRDALGGLFLTFVGVDGIRGYCLS